MRVSGYMVEAEWDGDVLVARGTNKVGQRALTGVPQDQSDVVIPKGEMADVKLKRAGRMVNGNLVIRTTGGQRYQLHFRRKDSDQFEALAEALGAA